MALTQPLSVVAPPGILIPYRISILVVGSAKFRREMSRHAPVYDRVQERMGEKMCPADLSLSHRKVRGHAVYSARSQFSDKFAE